MARAKKARKSAKKSVTKKSRKKPSRAAKTKAKRSPKKAAAKRAKKKPARKKVARKPRKAAAGRKLLTLTEVSKRTGISMPTLQRYKKEYQSRLPTVGEGRSQRYPVSALPVFEKIKKENLKKRGRPRKSAAPAKKKARRQKGGKSGGGDLISLSEIGRRTGISYPTLLRYGRLYGDRIPSHGSGRKRRFPESAVAVFQELRQQSRRGRRKGSGAKRRTAGGASAGLAARVRRLEMRNRRLEKQMKALVKALRKPLVGKV